MVGQFHSFFLARRPKSDQQGHCVRLATLEIGCTQSEPLSLRFSLLFGQGNPQTQGPLNGGVSRSGLVLPFLSFLGLSRFFRDFPDLLGDGPGIFPIRPFSFSRPIKSTYGEQSRKGPRHNLDFSRKKWETPRLGISQQNRWKRKQRSTPRQSGSRNERGNYLLTLVTRIAATSNRKSLATATATQKNHCDSENTCNTAISLRFLRETLAT